MLKFDMSKRMPLVMLVTVLLAVFLAPIMSLEAKQSVYTLSVMLKDTMVFSLPFIIFGLIFCTAAALSGNVTRIALMVLAMVCCSNFFTTFISHYPGSWLYNFGCSAIVPRGSGGLEPLWEVSFPKLITTDKALFAGLVLGIVCTRLNPSATASAVKKISNITQYAMKVIVHLVPLFIAGFVIKLQTDGIMQMIVRDYAAILAFVAVAHVIYLACMYFFLNKCNIKAFVNGIKNMMPAAISGFMTMSSAASMPLTILGAENNAENKELVRFVVPATTNLHLVGDCIAIPMLAYAILKSFGLPEPTLAQYVMFSLHFVLAKFSVAAVPGGGIMVMIPILERYLGFTSGMSSLITALYIMLDPVITCANVLGNGAFSKAIDMIPSLARIRTQTPAETYN